MNIINEMHQTSEHQQVTMVGLFGNIDKSMLRNMALKIYVQLLACERSHTATSAARQHVCYFGDSCR